MGESFWHWRSELNTKYIQKGLTPFNEFGKITPSQWEELMAQKTSPEALELSARNTELAKRNKHHHHLGPVATMPRKSSLGRWTKRPQLLGISMWRIWKYAQGIGYIRGVQNHPVIILSLISQRPKRQFKNTEICWRQGEGLIQSF